MHDGTIVYIHNKHYKQGKLVFVYKQVINNKPYFQQDEGDILVAHSNDDDQMINRKRNQDGSIYFETNDGTPMMRCQANDKVGSICFRKDDDATYTYKYTLNENNEPKIETTKYKIERKKLEPKKLDKSQYEVVEGTDASGG